MAKAFVIPLLFSGLALLFACTADSLPKSASWQQLSTIEDIWEYRPQYLRTLFAALNVEDPALSSVKSRLLTGDTLGGARLLLDHFKGVDREWVISTLEAPPAADVITLADGLSRDSITLQGHRVKLPLKSTGGWQWHYTGPDKDDEFGYSLNGHKYLSALLVAANQAERSDYIISLDRIVKDWIIHHPLPAAGDSIYIVLDTSQSLDWRDIGEVEWRTLETGHRLGAIWPQAFYALQQSSAFSAATRLLMLSSIADQAAYLRRYHKSGHNWTTMEMNGLAMAGLAFPEFRKAGEWSDYALSVMKLELQRQVYPDGTQTEISTKTQWVALRRFESVAQNFESAGSPLPESYLQRVERMYNYLAYAMRPDGHQPLNNDSDREDLRPRVLAAAQKFGRADWQWVATNGSEGHLPEFSPTVTFPWAGIHIFRNGWHETAHWAFFDAGPYGTGHQHRDKLHLSITAFGKDLLVDGGRYTHQDYFSFDPSIWRGYFRSSFSHNVILVDGQGQQEGALRAASALKENRDYRHTAKFNYAHGSFTKGFEQVEGHCAHHRSVLYIRDRFWIVLDHLDTDRPRELQALWHYAPDCEVRLEEKSAVSADAGAANLRIVPLGQINWEPQITKGQESPFIQGWYSEHYGTKEASPTVIFSTNIPRSAIFGWLMMPAVGEPSSPDIRFQLQGNNVVITVNELNHDLIRCTLPVDGNASKVRVD